jgi:hypothetical protein
VAEAFSTPIPQDRNHVRGVCGQRTRRGRTPFVARTFGRREHAALAPG